MPRKKASSDQPVLAAILPPGPAEKAIAAAKQRAKPTKPKPPTAASLTEMIKRLAQHTENIRSLLADIQTIAEWPLADPDHENNLSGQIAAMLKPVDIDTDGATTMEVNFTLNALLIDVQSVLDDLQPGVEQSAWAKEILGNPSESTPKPVGMPSKGRPKATK
jgi:hypothetical protein